MAMNFTSRITNQSTIYYAQSKGLKVAGLPRSPKAKKDGKFSTKDWVFGSFYSANKISAPASEPALASVKIRSPQRISPTTQQCGTNTAEFRKSRASRNVPTYEGKPAVFFEQSRIDGVAKSEKFKFSLVGKFPFRRPSLEQISAWVGRELKLKGLWSITLLDSKHVLLRLDNEADMGVLSGLLVSELSDAEEPSLAAVWISLPLLPVAFFEQNLLYSIASLVGEVLCADGPTKKLSRTNVARVCVEVDLLEELPHRVYIGVGEAGFWQDISYEKLPFYCAGCRRFGHSTAICKFNKTGLDVDKPLENVVNVISHLEKPNDETKRKDCLDHISGKNLYQTCPVFKCKDVNGNSISGSSPLVGVKQCTAGESSKNRSRLEVVASVGKSWTFEQNCPSSRSNEKTSSNNLAIKDTQTQGTDTQSRTFVLDKADNSQVSVSSHLELKSKTIVEEEDGVDHEIDGDVNNDVGHEVSGGYDSKENQSCRQNTLRETHDALESNSFFKLSVMQSPPSRKKFTLDKSIFFWKRKPKEVHIGPLRTYSLCDLRIATNSFNKKRILGRGGFGEVYKGQLPDGSLVAIKRLKEEMTPGGLVMFQNEVEMCSKAVHRNILQLRGFCVSRNERLLVYPYMVNGSVASRLRERSTNEPPLNWIQRKRIALGTARGLSYLHDHCNPKIIHRDVKAANILLDGNFEAVVGDFGLVKFMNSDDSHLTTAVRGTIGHLPPEYLSTGKITEKCDVFGYGIMLLELISGQRAFDLARLANDDDVMLRDWVKGLLKEQKLDMVLDPDLRSNYLEAEVEQLIQIAILCTQDCPIERPKMSEVLTMLEGDGLAERWEEWQKIEEVRQAVELFPQPDSVDSTNSVLSSPR